MTEQHTTAPLDSLLLTVKDKQLLLPSVAVVDVIDFSNLLTTASSVKWMLGKVSWRSLSVPVISYERLNQHPAPAPNTNARFAIIRSLNNNPKLPYYGILCQNTPTPVSIKEEQLQAVLSTNTQTNQPYDSYQVKLLNHPDTTATCIPDLDKIEQMLGEVV